VTPGHATYYEVSPAMRSAAVMAPQPAPARWTSGRRPPCRAHGGARLRAWRCRLAT